MDERRVAILVDGDNISPTFAELILQKAAALGRVDISRVYTSGANQTDWLNMAGYRAMHAGTGKNASDLLLSVDAMEIALIQKTEICVIASSDGDFSHLAHRLREYGVLILGLGEKKAPDRFRLACSAFEVLASPTPPKSKTELQESTTNVTQFDNDIRLMISAHSKNGQGMRIVDLAPKMSVTHGTRISAHPEKNWRAYLTKRPTLFDVDPRGPEAMVRYRMSGFNGH